jgi:hypothetical protein
MPDLKTVKNPNEPASEKQKAFALTLGVDVPADATKGQASQLISEALAKQKTARQVESEAGDAIALSIATLEKSIASQQALLAELRGEAKWTS